MIVIAFEDKPTDDVSTWPALPRTTKRLIGGRRCRSRSQAASEAASEGVREFPWARAVDWSLELAFESS